MKIPRNSIKTTKVARFPFEYTAKEKEAALYYHYQTLSYHLTLSFISFEKGTTYTPSHNTQWVQDPYNPLSQHTHLLSSLFCLIEMTQRRWWLGFRSGERQRRFSGRLRHLKTPVWLEKLFRKSRYMWLLCTGVCVYGKSKKARKTQNFNDAAVMAKIRRRWCDCMYDEKCARF